MAWLRGEDLYRVSWTIRADAGIPRQLLDIWDSGWETVHKLSV